MADLLERISIVTESTYDLYSISRRAVRIAAGTLSALMCLSAGAYARSPASGGPSSELPAFERSHSQVKSGPAWLTGTVTDANGTIVPGATVSAVNERTGFTRTGATNDTGEYRLEVSAGDFYEVRIVSPGFADHIIQRVDMNSARESRQDAQLVAKDMEVFLPVLIVTYDHVRPLSLAVAQDDLDTVIKLLKGGANPNLVEKDGLTALDLAVINGNVEIARRLLTAGASVHHRGSDGSTILSRVNREDSREMVSLLIKAGAKINAVDNEGNTPLLKAANLNEPELIRVLLKAGAHINAQNHRGNSALMIAAADGNAGTVEALLEAGANHRLRNADGENAFAISRKTEYVSIHRLLREAGAHDPNEEQR